MTLLEALAMGTPVATSGPWLPEDLASFATVDADVLEMIRKGLAHAADVDRRAVRKAVLSRYTWDHIARRYLDRFEEVIAAQGPEVAS